MLDYNLSKAKIQFRQVDSMLRCFEYWMGPYPFYEDSYKLVEAPHLGMEHQSAIAYGNGFVEGFAGKDLSGTGWGMKWDFILVHESAHEWFGNSITAKGDGDSWIHEGFAKYLETIYTDYISGKEAGNDYAIGIWKRIKNDESIIGGNTSDKYNKGSAVLHMIRQVLGDGGFRALLRGLNKQFYHQVVSTAELTAYCSKSTGRDLSKIFNQYLRTVQVPVLEYSIRGTILKYRWANSIKGFNMPVKVNPVGGQPMWLHPSDQWKQLPPGQWKGSSLVADRNFYISCRALTL